MPDPDKLSEAAAPAVMDELGIALEPLAFALPDRTGALILDTEAAVTAFNVAAARHSKRDKPALDPRHAPLMVRVLATLGVAPAEGFLADWYMLHARGDFASCRQPADYIRAFLRLKLQQVGEG